MGKDIHMAIVKDRKYIIEDAYKGRSSEWFANLSGDGWDKEYDYLPVKYNISEQAPDEYVQRYTPDWCFDYRYIKVQDFMDWFEKYKPNLHAGWVSTYEKWEIENKGVAPEDLPQTMPEEGRPEDWHFIKYIDPYDCSAYLYNLILENKIPADADITYCFDW